RTALKEHDWNQYQDKILLVYCSTDAIIPVWAYMLVAASAQGDASQVFQGTEEAFLTNHYEKVITNLPLAEYEDKRIVVKGCSDRPIPASAYLTVTAHLQAVAKSIMYGEPCSTVPIWKRPR
ncbi:MAG: DUF2480 family protein, partial [Bacteroidota bacterium]